jgi:ParB-like chromosome segregation protein Spo0J
MKINPSLASLVLPIEKLVPLEGNPRRGVVSAIAASYAEFGQVKPIVVRPNDDGTFTVLAGNHQVEAAKSLGWDSIAAVQMNEDDRKSIAFALADNRTSEIGSSDPDSLIQMIQEVSLDYKDLVENLGWDDFEMAAMEELAHVEVGVERGYVPPAIVEPLPVPISSYGQQDAQQPNAIQIDSQKAAVMGAAKASLGQKSVVQYTLVFDNADQQRRWYEFIRFLRSTPAGDGDTTAARLIEFIESHADF